MNARYRASIELQAPEIQAAKYGYRDPASLIGRNICCKCQREVTTHAFIAKDGSRIETHHCPEHGDVSPMRSIIHNIQGIRP